MYERSLTTNRGRKMLFIVQVSDSILLHDDKEERYLAYLPHSGLSNQRIELANALLLAYMLKRTLIIPPAFLGTVFGWMERERLAEHLEWLTTPKDFDKICQRATPGRLRTYIERSRCEEYRMFGAMPWSELHDFSSLGIKVQFHSIVTTEELQRMFRLSKDDIYLYKDTHLYDWRLYENKTEAQDLLANTANYFDSFGGRRKTVKGIVDYLGGKKQYLGLHFRTSDKPFNKLVTQNLEAFVTNMTEIIDQYDLNQENLSCDDGTPRIYLATDHGNPRGNLSPLLPWFERFPCTTTLDDVPSHLFEPLDEIRDIINPRKSLKPFLIPLVDSMVAAHARHVLTTPRSTFSKYIEDLYHAWS
ncbi:hypothetical protein K501DRAFT_324857 [Backusella circina FSU 941]|nr:hypothetical protein K501DRAFT_324857 [Backusella circina FSU 941]